MESKKELYGSILITGGGGMLAHALVDVLAQRGHRATALSRAQCDVTDAPCVRQFFDKHRPTLVLNCAAHTKVDLCEKEREKAEAINGLAVGILGRLSAEFGSCVVHVSTDFVFDGSQQRPYRPDDRVSPINAYGRSKLLGEIQLQENAPLRWLIVRTAWVYGRHGANFPRTMVQAAQAGKPLRVVGDQHGSPTYTIDLAEAILDLLDSGASGIWHVTNAGQTTWFDFAVATLEEFGIDASIEPLKSAQWTAMRPDSAPRPTYSVLDVEPTAIQLGRPMRDWRTALKDFRQAVDRNGF
ncbi:MAG: dTDP-4-dehydrorhamnose reductase [Planctomycetota bacterium]|nr:dTDP-4-dehydrorhamnose reductase [Planctomycetota bacterium]